MGSSDAPLGPGADAVLGREAELADLDARLRSHRLVTVVGPGGVGKTTLAREAARRAAARFPLGVRFVDLARIDTPDAVPGSFAAQLGFASFEALVESPVDQPALLIADNCEHVLDAAATAVGELLERCAMPTVLATSRSPLSLLGETVVALAPLPVPAIDDPAAREAPVVRLFLARARDAGAQLGARDVVAVVPLCARLDGLPLAVEIAAARTRGMSVADLLGRVADGVDVLHRPRFRGAARHRSVSDVIRWSVDLLGAGEVDLLERLAVLHGAFTRTAARRMSTGSDESFESAFEDLIHASLVSVDTSGDVTRYRLLDIVRRYALDRLRARGDLEDRYDRFVDQVLALTWARLMESGPPAALRDAVDEFDDIAVAVRWCVEHDRDPRRALRLCTALLVVVEQGRAEDVTALARAVFDRWPEAVADGVPCAAEAVATLANGENLTGHPARGLERARSALATVTEPSLAAVTLRQAIGDCAVALGDRPAAERSYAAAAAIARRTGRVPHALELEIAHAQLRADAGDGHALAAIDAAGAEADAVGATLTAAWAATVRAWLTLRTAPAHAPVEAALAACRAAGFGNGVAANLRSLVFRGLLAGDLDGATDALEALRDQLLDQRSLANLRMLVDAAAALAHRAGHPAWPSLAATVATLPSATLLAAGGPALVPLPETTAEPLPVRGCLQAVAALVADLRDRAAADRPTDRRSDPADRRGDATGRGADPTDRRIDPADPTADAPGAAAALHRSGDVWTVAFAGRRVSVRASKGWETLAALLAASGRQIHCLDLMGAGVEQRSTGEVVDATARRRYEERIRELQADIDAAEADHDFARAERAQVEFDALVEHLAAALGHTGKARRAGDTVERARSAVTHRVRSAIRQIGDVHEPLARHLKHAVSTGTYCAYRPEQPVEWDVRFTS